MNSVIKGTGYVLVHVPDMVMQNGVTVTTEKIVNPEGEFLKNVASHLRSYEDAMNYWPSQVYIGNKHPEELRQVEFPYYDKKVEGASRFGKYGEVMPQDEFLLLVQACDVFQVVELDKDFVAATKEKFTANEIMSEDIVARINDGVELSAIEAAVNDEHAEPLFNDGKLVGCVKRAHDIDSNLSAHIMHENLMCKASSVLALLYALKNAGVAKEDVDYVIDCAEEACGDMLQRGGGNFAKAAAEIAGLVNATGSDVRGFCAAPAHAIISAASLVKAGTYKTVVVTSGGCTAKLGMNGKNHVEKNIPILEDVLGGFAVVITENDGVSPEINNEVIGRVRVGAGTAPQVVYEALVKNPLAEAGMKITDIDKYAAELHNADVLKPAGGGDPALQGYKVVGALAVKGGEIDKKELASFTEKHGFVGWAPVQGHIPSGAPCMGVVREDIMAGEYKKAMVIGKGSLFLGRMTNLFDGVSFIIQENSGAEAAASVSEEQVKSLIAEAMKNFAMSIMPEA